MSAQGYLELDCVTTQQDTGTIYGIATANGRIGVDTEGFYIVLIKSNPSPSSLASLTWSIVSTTNRASDLSYVYPTFATVDCAVNSKGEFTALFRNSELPTSMSPTIPMGVRYDPVYDSWSGVRGSPMYGWNVDPWHQLFYTKGDPASGKNVESLVHLMADEIGSVLRFGTVDTATNMLQLADIWKRDEDTKEYSSGSFSDEFDINSGNSPGMRSYGFFGAIWDSDQRLFTPGPNQLYANLDMDNAISVFPCTSAVTASRTSTSSFSKHPSFSSTKFFSGTRGNMTTFVAAMGYSAQPSMYTVERNISGSWTQSPVYNITGANSTGEFDVHRNIISAGGQQPDQEPFAVAVTTLGLYELQLFGPYAGNLTGPFRVIIPTPLYSSRPAQNKFNNESGMSASEQVGVVIGVVFAGVAVALYIRSRKRKRQQKHEEKERLSQRAVGMGGESYMMGMIPASQTMSKGAIEVNTNGGGRGGEGGIGFVERGFRSTVPSSVGSPLLNSVLTYTYQDEIQGLELSTHPRPNIVTTITTHKLT